MKKYIFCKTNDTSVGLYNNEVKDIYHSSGGALKESIEKFIIPSGFIDYCALNDSVSVLDICYGIGYNTKAALYFSQITNKNISLNIDALDIDEELILLSPFVKDTVPSLDLHLFLVQQILLKDKSISSKLKKTIDFIKKENYEHFDLKIMNSIKNYLSGGCKQSRTRQNEAFLHNIYYEYISSSMKNSLKSNIYANSSFNYHCGDARCTLRKLNTAYDFVFLDAFTPQKDPTLWTYHFLKLIKSKMKNDSILISYSNSTPFRAALLELGFHVGKVILNNKQFGTVASLNKNLIINPLDSIDIGITSTTGGIYYKDKKLNLTKEEIIFNRETEKSKSDRISTSRFKKDNVNAKI